jgi:diguanylate cyclase (GGDEF)-like protein
MANDKTLMEETTKHFSVAKLERRSQSDALEACLIAIRGSNVGGRTVLNKDEVVIGRSPQADVQVNEESASRQHAVITRHGAVFLIKDLNSKNGTFVNNAKKAAAVLNDQDVIAIGGALFKFISGTSVELPYHEELHKLATLDPMLGIYNKRFFLDYLEQTCRRLGDSQTPFSVVLFDVDHFKQVNDNHGHRAGDRVLEQVSAAVKAILRRSDLFSRYGGEEFGVLLLGNNSEQAVLAAEKLRRAVQASAIAHGEIEIRVTISLGIATFDPAWPVSSAELIEQADSALYQAKRTGRNRVVVHSYRGVKSETRQ